jgi:hypothetical protein
MKRLFLTPLRNPSLPFRLNTAIADMTDENDFDWPEDPGAKIGLGEIVVAFLALAAFTILGRRTMSALAREHPRE